jgi:hypothetical protein
MSERFLNDKVNGYEISTVRTDAGGAAPSSILFGLLSSADYEDCNAWPFETMVFKVGSRKGLYHEPYDNEQAARQGHTRILGAVTAGTLEFGTTVQGEQGLPLITPEQWRARVKAAEDSER